MRAGAFGLSTSLQYAPAPYANTEELIALAAEAGRYGGIYSTHMRSEQNGIMDSLDETIRIGREAHVPVEIWHLKTAGKSNWGRMPEVIAKIEKARAKRCRRGSRHLRVYSVVQQFFGIRSPMGTRRRRRQADRTDEGSNNPRPHPQGYDQ